MIDKIKPLYEINNEVIHILKKEIGLSNTIRFFNQFTTGYGNYTKDKTDKFDGMSVNDIVSEIRINNKNQN